MSGRIGDTREEEEEEEEEEEREREKDRAVFRNRNLCCSVVHNNGLHRSCDYSCYAIVCAFRSDGIPLYHFTIVIFFIWILAENISAKMSNGKRFQLTPK